MRSRCRLGATTAFRNILPSILRTCTCVKVVNRTYLKKITHSQSILKRHSVKNTTSRCRFGSTSTYRKILRNARCATRTWANENLKHSINLTMLLLPSILGTFTCVQVVILTYLKKITHSQSILKRDSVLKHDKSLSVRGQYHLP